MTATARIWIPPLALIFCLGGPLQYLGLFSPTTTNVIALFLIFAILFRRRSFYRELKQEWLILFLVAYVFFLQLALHAPLLSWVTYLYYGLCTCVAAVAGRLFCRDYFQNKDVRSYTKLVPVLLSAEFFVVTLQRVFSDQLVSNARVPLGKTDAIFGTLFLQSDATLGVVSILLAITLFIVPASRIQRFAAVLLSVAIVFSTNSSASMVTAICAIPLLLVGKIGGRFRGRNAALLATALVAILLLLLCEWSLVQSTLENAKDEIAHSFDKRFSSNSAGRFAPLGSFLFERVTFFGYGALTYYNPITKEWLYNSGFSTLYSLYLDTGVIGLLTVVVYYAIRIWKTSTDALVAFVISIVAVGFSLFNFALSDLAFVFILNFVVQLRRATAKQVIGPHAYG